jgi:uncharacterized protein with GYD domain
MTTYVMLANWTDQGIQKVKDSPRRLDTAKKALDGFPEHRTTCRHVGGQGRH